MASIMVTLCILAIVLAVSRGLIGYETPQMAFFSIFLGGGVAYSMWNLVDIRIGDVFQIKTNMAPNQTSGMATPVMCISPT